MNRYEEALKDLLMEMECERQAESIPSVGIQYRGAVAKNMKQARENKILEAYGRRLRSQKRCAELVAEGDAAAALMNDLRLLTEVSS